MPANVYIQLYLQQLHSCTQYNNLMLNSDKTTCALFTPDPAEYNTMPHLQIDNITLPCKTPPKS